MTDSELWEGAVAAVSGEYASLATDARLFVSGRSAAIRERKEVLHAFSTAVDAGEICAACKGECCARGKNHVTVIDLLVHLSAGRPLVTPRFDADLCPYLGAGGCLMTPEFRPFNCIIFYCDRIEGLLEPAERERFRRIEGELRALCAEMEEFFGARFMQGLFLTYERAVAEGKRVLANLQSR